MNSKALLFLAILLASILLISVEAAPKDKKDDKTEADRVDDSKYGYNGGWGYGGPWRGGYGGWRGGYGGWGGGYGGWRGGYGGWGSPWRGGYGGGWGGPWRGGYGGWGGGWPAKHSEAHTNDGPQT